ncbi:TonB-dependent receptor domain-containing protein [Phenylobacterium sp.]|uniref:TonB-dependent receptor domain-containing protein n=1 Tax=Phenylobacterium sp. TaxID=1871053 RepID=UPI002DF57226|nr:TonB-dependent receptor [Phenylobacterium sp.]
MRLIGGGRAALVLGLFVAGGLAAVPAAAQAPRAADDGRQVKYDPAFFAASRPESAYDMVLLLPGFAFDPGQGLRGFAGAAGNVLIDGKRPTSKTDTLSDILKRIPAASVARIELIRGGAPGVDMLGQAVVANVVRRASRELANTSDALVTKDGRVGFTTRFDASRRSGAEGVQASLYLFYHQGGNAGHGTKDRFDAAGRSFSQAEVHIQNPNSGVLATGEADVQQLGGLLRLKGYLIYGTNKQPEEDAVLDAGGFRQDLITSQFRTRHVEVSGEFTRTFAQTVELSLIGVQNLERLDGGNNARQAGLIVHSGDDATEGESILRGRLTYAASPRWTFEAGGEGTYNFLDARSRLIVADVPQLLPSQDVQVQESRAEPFATLTWRPGPRLTVEAGARYELSQLTVSGDAHNSASFRFPKPRLLVTWTPIQADQLRFRLERVVGQLSFDAFVTSSSLDQGVITGGNPGLEPERDWIAEGAWDHRFGKDVDVVATLSHAALEKVVDQLPVNGLSAPGNIGDGVRDRADLNVTFPLGWLGMSGGRVKGQGTWVRSRVTDPTTGRRRMITDDQPFSGTAALTNDVPRLRSAWRIDLTSAYRYSEFRIDEIDNFRFATQLSALWEWKARPGLDLQAQVQNIGGGQQVRERQVFTGLRNTHGLAFRELRDVNTGPRLYLRLRKTF